MVDPELLNLLCCPETHQGLRLADQALLGKLNQKINAGAVRNRGGHMVSQQLVAGLLREDGRVLYPVRNDIPVMLVEEGIGLE
jgi:uncharacterized protein YbaR (Trm112 family)